MKKINIVKKNDEFNNVINIGLKIKNDIFYVYYIKNDFKYNRYGFAVSKKIGNAVVRNKYRRQIKDIIDDININFSNLDIIFIARGNIKNYNYSNIKVKVIELMKKIGEENEKK